MERRSSDDDRDLNPDEKALDGEDAPTGIVFPERRGRLYGFDYSDGDYRSLGYGEPPESYFRKTRYDQTVLTREELLRLARARSALDRDARPLPGRHRYRGLRLGRGVRKERGTGRAEMLESQGMPVKRPAVPPGSFVTDGLLAGAMGTGAMTVVMFLLQRPVVGRLSDIPPQEVMAGVAKQRGAGRLGTKVAKRLLAPPAHFAFGAATGLLLSEWVRRQPENPMLKGALFGAAVWAGSYMGVLPRLGITRPIREKSKRRVAVNILSHLAWGAITALVAEALHGDREAALGEASAVEEEEAA